MTENELKIYLQERYPKENESCEWKEFKTRLYDSLVKLNSFIISNIPLESVKWWKPKQSDGSVQDTLKMFNEEYVCFKRVM